MLAPASAAIAAYDINRGKFTWSITSVTYLQVSLKQRQTRLSALQSPGGTLRAQGKSKL